MPRMSEKELNEGRMVGIPDWILNKMSQGLRLSDFEKGWVRKSGKVYVESHYRDDKWVRPQLRNIPSSGKHRFGGGRWVIANKVIEDASNELGDLAEELIKETPEKHNEIVRMLSQANSFLDAGNYEMAEHGVRNARKIMYNYLEDKQRSLEVEFN